MLCLTGKEPSLVVVLYVLTTVANFSGVPVQALRARGCRVYLSTDKTDQRADFRIVELRFEGSKGATSCRRAYDRDPVSFQNGDRTIHKIQWRKPG